MHRLSLPRLAAAMITTCMLPAAIPVTVDNPT